MDGGLVRRSLALAAPALLTALACSAAPPAPEAAPPPRRSPSPSLSPSPSHEVAPFFPGEDSALRVAGTARAYFATRPEAFGGVYLDRAAGRTVVLVTADRQRHEQALRRLADDEAEFLALRVVRYAYADLEHVVATVAGHVDGATAGWVDETGNRAVVGLAEDTPAARERVLRALPARYWPMVRFQQAPVTTFA